MCRPLFDKILITKLAMNQELECEIFCTKNVGRKHTKWSPVSTVFYRLLPVVKIQQEIKGKIATDMQELCPKNVFGVSKNKRKENVLEVRNEKDCSMCRACVSHPDLEGKIFLGKERMNYELTIESVGVLEPLDIFIRSLEILKNKCEYYESYFKNL
jgi:DNA-directed RNA polymerase I and III subunit RPAC1